MIVQSQERNSKSAISSSKSAIFSFASEGRDLNLKSDESLEVMENLAKREFLDSGTMITEICFKTPFVFLNVGDVICLNSHSYNIPQQTGKDKFMVTKVVLEIESKSAYISVTARRWD